MNALTERNAERERLIELLEKAIRYADENYCGRHKDGKFCGLMSEHLLANDVVVPPVKVGQTVYKIYGYEILEIVVENVVVGLNPSKCNVYTKDNLMLLKEVWYKESFGEQLFFTKEAAEKALAERRNDEKV